jgi:lysophospholipase L1-like esterase
MIHGTSEFFATAEAPERSGGFQLLRVPIAVGQQLSARGRWNSQQTQGCEVRFVTEAPHFRIFLSSLEGDAEVLVFRGETLVANAWLDPGRQLCLHVYAPDNTANVDGGVLARGSRFSPHVWRIMLAGYQTVFHELDTFGWEVRAPLPAETPRTTWLAYGSSITAGCGASRTDLCYTQLTARRLGVDVLNMGFGGACHCEPVLADFFAAGLAWDFATIELGVNMREHARFEIDEFAKRAGYFIDRLLGAAPARPVIVITPFVSGAEYGAGPADELRRQREYEVWLRQRVAADGSGRLHLVEGHELLPELHALNADMVHPGAYGHVLIGERLAARLAILLPKLMEMSEGIAS